MKVMNCEMAQNELLLRSAGELGFLRARRLASHLEACAACRAFEADLQRMTAAVRDMVWSPEVEAALDRAENHARRCLREAACRTGIPARPAAHPFAPFGRPAMALAATLLVALTGMVWLRYAAESRTPGGARGMAEFVTLVSNDNTDRDIAETRLAIERLSSMLAEPVTADMSVDQPPAPTDTAPDWSRQDDSFDEEVV